MPVYTGKHTRNKSFHLGGIGTGSIGLSGDGRLDWDIFLKRPNKGSSYSYTHFAVKASYKGETVDARVINCDLWIMKV